MHAITTNNYCPNPRLTRLRDDGKTLSWMARKGSWVFWAVPLAADGSVTNAERIDNDGSAIKQNWQINVPPGKGPRVVTMVSRTWACRFELRP